MPMRIKFWGVRGSIACPSPAYVKYGGNTSCLEVDYGGHPIILDAGTGIRGLGKEFLRRDVKRAHILLTHTHWDHINGFPFFVPAFNPHGDFHLMAGHLPENNGIKNVLSFQMTNPMFPVPLDTMQASIIYEDFAAGDDFTIHDSVKVRTTQLNHPDRATGYRLDVGGHSLCYITDTEHVPGKLDENILALIEGADLMVYDSTYTEEEFPSKVGWGHSTWQEGVRLCKAANVKRLAVFHHDPDHDDNFMEALELEALQAWDGLFVARDEMTVVLD